MTALAHSPQRPADSLAGAAPDAPRTPAPDAVRTAAPDAALTSAPAPAPVPALRLVPDRAPAVPAAHYATAPAADPGGRHRPRRRITGWWSKVLGTARHSADTGMATAEYAIVTVAAAAFAGLLIVILRSDEVRGLLLGIIRGALSV